MNRIIVKVECPCCRSTVLVSASEKGRRVQALADRGKPWTLVMLGIHPRGGIGTEKNAALAVECFRQAAEMGYTIGQRYLGECYLLGLGTETE
jgi:TPR repeat protein